MAVPFSLATGTSYDADQRVMKQVLTDMKPMVIIAAQKHR
jgi:hypothetical protein